ncbi:nucleoplasmin-like protein ANO39 [Helianthus annuus]|uniref:nucleoplasmin-like protein ANO39 n=1 Tax=Helianthus annuus TaxID=4232 RepID=UPI000B9076A8|nr:nucleoplasmin-like protein ANO39 [Helianthus annuus]
MKHKDVVLGHCYPRHEYGTYHSYTENQHKLEYEEGAKEFEENDNEVEEGANDFEENDNEVEECAKDFEENDNEIEEGVMHFEEGVHDDEGANEEGVDDEERANAEGANEEDDNDEKKTKKEKLRKVTSTITKGEGSSARTVKIWLQCDRGGEPKSKATVRRSSSKKVGCPFSPIGKLDSSSGNWSLVEKKNIHNHEPTQFLEGHAFSRRLTPDKESLVERLYLQNMEPTNIHLTVRKQNRHNVCILQDVQNTIKKIKLKMYGDRTPMQILENMLQEERLIT